MELPGFRTEVELVHETPAPPSLEPLLTPEIASERSALILGLEVPPIFRETPDGPAYPAALWHLRRQLSRALESSFSEFMRVQNAGEPEDFRALGRSAPVAALWNADRDMAAVGRNFNLLLAVTPVNSESEWKEFRAHKYAKLPTFQYRLLPFDPDLLKRQLYKIKLENVEGPGFAAFAARQAHRVGQANYFAGRPRFATLFARQCGAVRQSRRQFVAAGVADFGRSANGPR